MKVAQAHQTQKNNSVAIIIVALLTIVLGVTVYLNRIAIYDWMLAMSYSASDEMKAIEDRIELTDRAKLIFAATHPELEQRDSFNQHCEANAEDISVLGCYSSGKIYIYNINEADLNGIVESTAAHELLHAVWERTDNGEKSRLTDYLIKIYDDEKYHNLLADDLETYDQKDRVDELHSRIGTEIADLPEELERHYARYFQNQDKVVDFYESYITPFRELDEEIKVLSGELETLGAEIETRTTDYYEKAQTLLKEVDEFNTCTNTEGCFATNAAFLARRNQLLAAQASLDELYESTNQLVEQYNTLVAEYNSHILRGEELEKAMNSRTEYESEIK